MFFNGEHRLAFDFEKPQEPMFLLENSLQIEVAEERTVSEVAQILRVFADVLVTKQSATIFWVQFQEFSTGASIESVMRDAKVKKLGHCRLPAEAIRFQSSE